MRLALVGAFPYPYGQGSQVYATEQARALAAAGARPTLLAYGRGDGPAPQGLDLALAPARLSPRALRSGPRWGKPVADAALFATLLRAHARLHFDAVLAHNAEAALVALAARPFLRVPVVYVAHTMMGVELSAYGPPRLARHFDAIGARVDRAIARRADAVVFLCEEASTMLGGAASGPSAVIPPGLDPKPPPDKRVIASVCRTHGLEVGRYILYTGNLDAYQELERLAAAARALPEACIAVATHGNASRGESAGLERVAGLHVAGVRDFDEMRALVHGAAVGVLTRRRPGGFPVKLLNYMEAGLPIVAYEGIAPGLREGRNAVLLPRDAGPSELARALASLLDDALRRARLGAAARHHLESAHAWPDLARQTLALVECVTQP